MHSDLPWGTPLPDPPPQGQGYRMFKKQSRVRNSKTHRTKSYSSRGFRSRLP